MSAFLRIASLCLILHTSSTASEVITFDSVPTGTVVHSIVVPGIGIVEVYGANPSHPGVNHAVVFDSSNPSGGDLDLGSPNQTCGGPGVSLDGAGTVGGAHPNCLQPEGPLAAHLQHVLIVAENLEDADMDGLVDDPDDEDDDGRLIFVFPIPVTFESITLLDIQASEDELADVRLFADPDGAVELLASPVELTEMGDNGVAIFDFPDEVFQFRSVRRMSVRLKGSGAIDNIVVSFCGDGIVGPGEECDGSGSGGMCPAESCRADCSCAVCGDGILDPGESCDGSESGDCSGPCRDDCTCCGDGTLNGDESCDGQDKGLCILCEPLLLDFEEFDPGRVVDHISLPSGVGVDVLGWRPDAPAHNHAIIFDTADPTGGDDDLGSPNQTCGGPGVSEDGAGEIAGTHPNCLHPDGPLARPLGHVLIVAESLSGVDDDGVVDVPDDFDGPATLTLIFDHLVRFESLTMMDLDAGEGETAALSLYSDEQGFGLLAQLDIPPQGDNGVVVFAIEPVPGVRRVDIDVTGSCAIDDIGVSLCTDTAVECNDDCTCAPVCGDGVIDDGESCDGQALGDCAGPCRPDCTCCGDGVVNGDGEECDVADRDCPETCAAVTMTFDGLRRGQIVNEVTLPHIGSVEVFGDNPVHPGINHAVIFDTNEPTGGDVDLGSPNNSCGGPGVSLDGAGEVGGAHPNCLQPNGALTAPLNNVLIVAEDLVDADLDGLVDDPDDVDDDSRLIFVFPVAVTFESITLLDIQASEDELADVRMFADAAGTQELLASPVELTEMGDNGVAIFEFPVDIFQFRSVRRLSVRLKGSGAIDNIVVIYCLDQEGCRDDCTCPTLEEGGGTVPDGSGEVVESHHQPAQPAPASGEPVDPDPEEVEPPARDIGQMPDDLPESSGARRSRGLERERRPAPARLRGERRR